MVMAKSTTKVMFVSSTIYKVGDLFLLIQSLWP